MTYELASQIGSDVALATYCNEQGERLGGFALLGQHMTFFIRLKPSQLNAPYLEVLDFQNLEIPNLFRYKTLVEGRLKALHQVVVDGYYRAAERRSMGLLLTFENGRKALVHPSETCSETTALAIGDKRLELLSKLRVPCRYAPIKKDLSWVNYP